MVEFINYDGGYPSLCWGDLELMIDGKEVKLSGVLRSGGMCGFSSSGDKLVDCGPWTIDLSRYPEYEVYGEEITETVNENVVWGCRGGCL